jgi:serine/threonine protein kinase
MLTYAMQLLGRKLDGGWSVVERLEKAEGETGGHFSLGYIVRRDDGQRAFLKALDYTKAFEDPDAMQQLLTAYIFERDLLKRCLQRNMNRVVRIIADGQVRMDPELPHTAVQYLIFELADGDIRKHLKLADQFDLAWALRSLHQVANGIAQLHAANIAHQDLKPSNVMTFEGAAKIGDLGRASLKDAPPLPHDEQCIAGDRTYAPPELAYGFILQDWRARRLGCDLYHLASIGTFLLTGVSLTALWLQELDESMRPGQWQGTFAEVLPFIRDAYDTAMARVGARLPPALRADTCELLRQLGDPDPALRGHPRNRIGHANHYSLERFVAKLDLLATKAEGGFLRISH